MAEDEPKREATLGDLYVAVMDIGIAYMRLSNAVAEILYTAEPSLDAVKRKVVEERIDTGFERVSNTLQRMLELGHPS